MTDKSCGFGFFVWVFFLMKVSAVNILTIVLKRLIP